MRQYTYMTEVWDRWKIQQYPYTDMLKPNKMSNPVKNRILFEVEP